MPLDFLTQAQARQTQAQQAPRTVGDTARENLNWLSRPDVRAGLLQFGVSMLSGANLGQGLGEGLGAAGRYHQNIGKREQQAGESERELQAHNLRMLEGMQRVRASEASVRQGDQQLSMAEKELAEQKDQNRFNREIRVDEARRSQQRLEQELEQIRQETVRAQMEARRAEQRLALDREKFTDDRMHREREFELRKAQFDAQAKQAKFSALSSARDKLSKQYQDIFKLVYDNYADEVSESLTGDQMFDSTVLAQRFNDALRLRDMQEVDTLMFNPAAQMMRQNGWPESRVHAFAEHYGQEELAAIARIPYQQWLKDLESGERNKNTADGQSVTQQAIPEAPGADYRGGPGQMGRRQLPANPLGAAQTAVDTDEQIRRLRELAIRGGRTGKLARDQLRRLLERNPNLGP